MFDSEVPTRPAPRRTHHAEIRRVLLACLMLTTAGVALAVAAPVPVSPGGSEEIRPAASSCPTFSWAEGGGAAVELVVSRLDTGGAPVLVEEIPPGATSWTPSADACLGGGRYVWFLRERATGGGTDGTTESTSAGLAFEVSALPSREELERSLRVVSRYLETTRGESGAVEKAAPETEAERTDRHDRPRSVPSRDLVRAIGASVNLADAAISGHHTGGVGSHVGVAGIVDSPDAAGVAAENTAGGADLVLAGPVEAEITESGWVLDDSAAQTFGFDNPSGTLTLQVEGEDVLTTGAIGGTVAAVGHDHLGDFWQGSGGVNGLWIDNQSSGGTGLRGDGVDRGLLGVATTASGVQAVGVEGGTLSPNQSAGVYGHADQGGGGGEAYGVWGQSSFSAGAGGVFTNSGGGNLIAAHNAAIPSPGSLKFSVDNDGNVSAASFAGDGSALTGVVATGTAPLSLWGSFGGPGGSDRTISGTENLGSTVRTYHDLTVPAGTTLVIDPGIGFISATGTCTIAGTITAEGKGKPGGNGATGVLGLGQPGYKAGTHWGAGPGMVSGNTRLEVQFAVAGGGGGGGGAGPWSTARGGAGGGASSAGGFGGCTNCASIHGGAGWNDFAKRNRLTGGGNGKTDFFGLFLHARGAGGGGGATGAAGGTGGQGGAGGGVVYLECANLSFTGTINAAGTPGAAGSGEAGGGGGGGGGVVLVRTQTVLANSGSISVAGGAGGSGAGGGGSGGNGQAGFGAVVDL